MQVAVLAVLRVEVVLVALTLLRGGNGCVFSAGGEALVNGFGGEIALGEIGFRGDCSGGALVLGGNWF